MHSESAKRFVVCILSFCQYAFHSQLSVFVLVCFLSRHIDWILRVWFYLLFQLINPKTVSVLYICFQKLFIFVSFQDLKDHFRQIGEVAFSKCHKEKIGEGYKSVFCMVFFYFWFLFIFIYSEVEPASDVVSFTFRVVEYASSKDVKTAMRKLDNSELFGKRIRLIDVSKSFRY